MLFLGTPYTTHMCAISYSSMTSFFICTQTHTAHTFAMWWWLRRKWIGRSWWKKEHGLCLLKVNYFAIVLTITFFAFVCACACVWSPCIWHLKFNWNCFESWTSKIQIYSHIHSFASTSVRQHIRPFVRSLVHQNRHRTVEKCIISASHYAYRHTHIPLCVWRIFAHCHLKCGTLAQ